MKLRITVENRSYEVDVEVLDEVTSPLPSAPAAAPAKRATSAAPRPAPAPKGPAVSGDGSIKAPIAGTVVTVQVKPGDVVAVNQVLIVMEAMKMETNIATPTAGKVKTVCVKPAEAVKAGQVLIELE